VRISVRPSVAAIREEDEAELMKRPTCGFGSPGLAGSLGALYQSEFLDPERYPPIRIV
jgi:hypothetical protein